MVKVQSIAIAWARARTKTSREHIFLPRILADGQIVIQAERARAIRTGQFMVWLCGCLVVVIVVIGVLILLLLVGNAVF